MSWRSLSRMSSMGVGIVRNCARWPEDGRVVFKKNCQAIVMISADICPRSRQFCGKIIIDTISITWQFFLKLYSRLQTAKADDLTLLQLLLVTFSAKLAIPPSPTPRASVSFLRLDNYKITLTFGILGWQGNFFWSGDGCGVEVESGGGERGSRLNFVHKFSKIWWRALTFSSSTPPPLITTACNVF